MVHMVHDTKICKDDHTPTSCYICLYIHNWKHVLNRTVWPHENMEVLWSRFLDMEDRVHNISWDKDDYEDRWILSMVACKFVGDDHHLHDIGDHKYDHMPVSPHIKPHTLILT